jgi:hypothetical protein
LGYALFQAAPLWWCLRGKWHGGKGGHKLSASHIRLSYTQLAQSGAKYLDAWFSMLP